MTRMAISPRLATRILLKSFFFIRTRRRPGGRCKRCGPSCSCPARRRNRPGSLSRHRQEWLVGADDLALLDVDLADLPGDRGDDVVLHLHGFEHCHDVAELDVIA